MQTREREMDIVKGLAIILMVLGHAEGPAGLTRWIYLFHMPVFFISAGYFFRRAQAAEPWTFVEKRLRGLYWPMVKWSVVFLVFHNLFFKIGLLNEQYGNWEGGVTHPYSWHQACQRLVNIVFSMAGYDEFLLGAFWFFRALFISSIVFLVLFRLLDGRWRWLSGERAAMAIAAAAVGFAAFRLGNGLKVMTIVQGGIRETWGVLFFALGYLYRQYKSYITDHWAVSLAAMGVLVAGACLRWHGMTLKPALVDVATLPLTGCAGFLLVHHAATLIDRRDTLLRRLLVHAGQMTVYIYVFHILAFKAVSAVKIVAYGLPWGQIGCHMVIHDHPKDLFWLAYTLAGVGLPLLYMYVYRRLKAYVITSHSKD